ncbi:MAG: hypothetical protein H6Q19_624 [Bacteroidetes bacterium]|nr:hypothetical protein [Bacteroidota bacterium]
MELVKFIFHAQFSSLGDYGAYFKAILINYNSKKMKSVVKKSSVTKNAKQPKQAQCCAKVSKFVAGCHD